MQYSSHRVFPVVGVLGLVIIALLSQFGANWIVNQIVAGGYPTWLPRLATVGQTVYVYKIGAAGLSYLIVPVLIFVVGYQYGKSQA